MTLCVHAPVLLKIDSFFPFSTKSSVWFFSVRYILCSHKHILWCARGCIIRLIVRRAYEKHAIPISQNHWKGAAKLNKWQSRKNTSYCCFIAQWLCCLLCHHLYKLHSCSLSLRQDIAPGRQMITMSDEYWDKNAGAVRIKTNIFAFEIYDFIQLFNCTLFKSPNIYLKITKNSSRTRLLKKSQKWTFIYSWTLPVSVSFCESLSPPLWY